MGYFGNWFIILLIFSLVYFMESSDVNISHFRSIGEGKNGFRNNVGPLLPPEIHPYISSGYRPINVDLDRHVVSIRTREPTAYFGDNHFCAGAIITSSIIITAAHCVVDGHRIVTRPRRLRVVAGSPNRLKKDQTTMEFMVSKVIPHPKFQRRKGYDIALLILSDSIPRSNTKIKIISLAKYRPRVGTECQTLGWGQLYVDGPYAGRITYGNLSIIPNSQCLKTYGHYFTKDLLCAANPSDPFVDTCRGDAGAPLMCHNKLVGIVSFSSTCRYFRPTIFTDITYHTKWILAMGRGVKINPQCVTALILLLQLNLGLIRKRMRHCWSSHPLFICFNLK
ncbi:trypsin-like [Musca domestica]|uniref:Trypsin-like n=1 Tax=Musca domestica TaxID=7370 RepID=A0ABM3V2E3_MUSDO|nr:trypsin-like [Musca domestica]